MQRRRAERANPSRSCENAFGRASRSESRSGPSRPVEPAFQSRRESAVGARGCGLGFAPARPIGLLHDADRADRRIAEIGVQPLAHAVRLVRELQRKRRIAADDQRRRARRRAASGSAPARYGRHRPRRRCPATRPEARRAPARASARSDRASPRSARRRASRPVATDTALLTTLARALASGGADGDIGGDARQASEAPAPAKPNRGSPHTDPPAPRRPARLVRPARAPASLARRPEGAAARASGPIPIASGSPKSCCSRRR